MRGYESWMYGDRIADLYDQWYAERPDTAGTVRRLAELAELAGPGPVLELGIGTGRVALPLAARGIDVRGIEVSEAMVARLRAKPGGQAIPVTVGDFGEVGVEGSFALVFAVFSTFFSLVSQEAQVRCFAGVARHLTPDGLFVLQAFVLDPARFTRNQGLAVAAVEADRVLLEATLLDPAEQRLSAQHVLVSQAGLRLVPVSIRYAWPSELDLMARLAGMRLRERTADWQGSPFTASSAGHVSVYELAPD